MLLYCASVLILVSVYKIKASALITFWKDFHIIAQTEFLWLLSTPASDWNTGQVIFTVTNKAHNHCYVVIRGWFMEAKAPNCVTDLISCRSSWCIARPPPNVSDITSPTSWNKYVNKKKWWAQLSGSCASACFPSNLQKPPKTHEDDDDAPEGYTLTHRGISSLSLNAKWPAAGRHRWAAARHYLALYWSFLMCDCWHTVGDSQINEVR